MKRLRFYVLYLFLLCAIPGFAQQKYTISGYFKDAKTGENLIGATLTIKELQGKGTGSNAYGFYSITLPAGHYQITGQFIGYAPQGLQINLNQPVKQNFALTEQINTLGEVEVSGQRKDENVSRMTMGMQKLNTSEIKSIPVLFGENDVLKTIQLLPGIKPAGEEAVVLTFGVVPLIKT